jgi:hypothetical protein
MLAALWHRQRSGKLKLAFAPAASGRGIEVAGFVLNPVDESCHFRVCAQRLCAGVMACQLGFCEQSMNLLVARAVHENSDDTTP